LILADEPTGNLDQKTGHDILRIFEDLAAKNQTIVLVTHDPGIGASAGRLVLMRDGRLQSDESQASVPAAAPSRPDHVFVPVTRSAVR
jgi:putative ABC transport system ATP-binding protein